ncbi:hypothetical protein [uncultured Tateyamaria sp.]|uniref:hypothetical protein n=1 Tax=Tateyamaria sp. 1078 TaxID=3417464 RepID=UPI0026131482|nr:hypothetical protein [uncultured Tateyamaria sp.]
MAKLRVLKPKLGTAAPKLAQSKQGKAPRARRSSGPYNTAAWQRLRLRVLRRDAVDLSDRPHLMPPHVLFKDAPLLWPKCQCTGVLLLGKYPAANSPVVDHIKPHRGDMTLFWDPNNLHSVSKAYHDKVKQSLERSGLA